MDLFPLLANRLSRDESIVPVYLGSWSGVQSLPTIDYPPIYYWFNTQIGAYVLTFNEPMLRKVCFLEAYDSGAIKDMSTESMVQIDQALDQLKALTMPAFQKMVEHMAPKTEKIENKQNSFIYKFVKLIGKIRG